MTVPLGYLAVLFHEYGGVSATKEESLTMAAIAASESSGNANATNKNTNGSTDYGLWQINSKAWPDLMTEDIMNPKVNAKAAGVVLRKQGLDAWVAYGSETYKKNRKAAEYTMKGVSWDQIAKSKDFKEAIETGDSKVSEFARGEDAEHPIESIKEATSKMIDLTPVTDFIRAQVAGIGVYMLAISLLLLGIYLIIKPVLPPVSVNPLPVKV